MWHAARAQEKKLRGMVVDHKKRAERKRAWFSARTMDAFQMIRCHGSKVNLEINPLQREIVESGKNL
jgi:arginine/serine-rich splicing factor 16